MISEAKMNTELVKPFDDTAGAMRHMLCCVMFCVASALSVVVPLQLL